jgi:hypothetical protein
VSEPGKVETIEEILANVEASRQRQRAAARPVPASDRLAAGTLVTLSEPAISKLGVRRARPDNSVGIVLGFDVRQQRYSVGWEDGMVEPLAIKYVIPVEG